MVSSAQIGWDVRTRFEPNLDLEACGQRLLYLFLKFLVMDRLDEQSARSP